MDNRTIYTAVGNLRRKTVGFGQAYPVIVVNRQEYAMDIQEMTVWTALCWRLLDFKQLENKYEMLAKSSPKVMLMLSILLTLLTTGHCTILYRQIGRETYECVEGVCIKIQKAPLRKQRSLCLLIDSGIEHTVTLNTRNPFRIGNCYRPFYLATEDSGMYQFFSAPQQFLALEDLGEYTIPDATQDAERA